jgi:hypothetical protein
MKIKDFIKMLQEADPTGEAHIRLAGGVPVGAQLKPGYYDGYFEYLDDDNNLVLSTKYNKVDISCVESFDIIEQTINTCNTYKDSIDDMWMKVKAKFKCELHYTDSFDNYMLTVKKEFDEWVIYQMKSDQEYLNTVIENYRNGSRYYRKKDFKNFYDGWIFKGDISLIANYATTNPILNSGRFEEKEIDDETYQYVLKEIF